MTVARTTQQYIEVGSLAENRAAKITQQYIEVGCLPDVPVNAIITQQYIEVAARQVIPFLSTPLDAASGVSLPVTFTWGAVPGASKYQTQVATEDTFASPVIDVETTSTSYTETGVLEAGTTYYWRVRCRLT